MSESTPAAEPTPEQTPSSSSTPDPTPGSSSDSTSGSTSGSTSASNAAATLQGADRLDLATIGAGVLVFLASLMPYYTVSVEGFGGDSANAWHGFFGWFGALCALAGAGVLVAKILGVTLPVPVRTTVLALFGLAAVCTLLALFVMPGGGCDDGGLGGEFCDMIDQGHGFGYWLALLASIAGVALAAVRRSAD